MKKRSGENQKVNVDAQQARFNTAMGDTTNRYENIYKIGQDDLDINSSQNKQVKATFDADAADNAAEAARLAARTGAQSGGVPAAVIAAQTANTVNQGYANSANTFSDYYQGNRQQGVQTMAGATANLAQIDNNAFNMGETARANNAAIDTATAKYKMNMLTGGLGVAGNLMMGNPAGALGSAQSMFAQQGGSVKGYQEGDFVPEGNGKDDYRAQLEGMEANYQSKLRDGLYTSGGDYTQKGLLSRYGFGEDAKIDTAYGGQYPNSRVGMVISEGDRRTKVDLAPGSRMEADKLLDESKIKSLWSAEDRAQGRGYVPGEGYAQGSFARYQMDQQRAQTQKDMDDLFGPGGFQTGGTVYMNKGGFLSRLLGGREPQEAMPSQRELEAMKPTADYYTDLRRDEHPADRLDPRHPGEVYGDVYQRPTPLASPQEFDQRDRFMHDDDYGPSQSDYARPIDENRLMDDGTIYNAGEEMWKKVRAEAKGQMQAPQMRQAGGFISNIPTRLGGELL